MASNQMPEGARKKIYHEIDKLFGRPLLAYACPLSYQERLALLRCNCTLKEIEAIEVLEYTGMLKTHDRAVMFVKGSREYAPGLRGGINYHLWSHDIPGESPDLEFAGIKNSSSESSRLKIYERLGTELAGRFFYWLDTAMDLSMEIEAARLTVQEIMTMAKTPGHLRRMVPELYKLSYHYQPTDQSVRASSVPYDWAAYPRQRVVALTTTMAKLTLLAAQPDGDSTEALWSKRDKFTWPISKED